MQQRLIILKQIYIFFSVIRSSADNVFRRLFIWIYALLNVISTMHRGYLTSLQTVRLRSHWSFFFFSFWVLETITLELFERNNFIPQHVCYNVWNYCCLPSFSFINSLITPLFFSFFTKKKEDLSNSLLPFLIGIFYYQYLFWKELELNSFSS